jgi:hypothetical protein
MALQLVVGRGANNPSPKKKKFVTKTSKAPRTWTDSLDKRPKQRNMNMRFGLWNVRSLYRVGSLMTVSKEQALYNVKFFRYIPAIATENFLLILSLCITTCFGPYGPSSGEHNTSFVILYIVEKALTTTTDPLFTSFVS